jgi:hypothetical protein
MRRRHLLHTSATAAAGALAGCLVLDRDVELRNPERTDEQGQTYWQFSHDGEKVSNVGFEYDDRAEGRRPLRFHTWHREGTHLDSFRIAFRFPVPAGDVGPEVYLQTFDSSPDPEIRFHDPESGKTVLDVPDLGAVGRGSLGVTFLLEPSDSAPEEVGVEIHETLSEEGNFGTRYVAEADGRIPFPGESDTGTEDRA